MGLFKKRQQTEAELEAMRAEMRSLRDHLARTDAVKDQLAERLGALDTENARLNQHVGSVEARVGEVASQVGSVEHEVVTVAGSIGPTVDRAIRTATSATPSVDDVEALRHEIRSLGSLAEQGGASVDEPLAELRARLEELAATLRVQQGQIADVALVATDASERSDRTDARIDELTTPDDWTPIETPPPPDEVETRRQLALLAERVASIDSRVDQVSLELTNQLTELSSDLERAGESGDNAELIEGIVDQLDAITGGQERLANEQARYAIAFREDLAGLANRLRKET